MSALSPSLDGTHLTPLHIEIVLWYNSRGVDIDNIDAPAVKQYIEHLYDEGILCSDLHANSRKSYLLTEKGRVFLEAILSVPFPTQTWQVKWPKVPA